jgi:formylglycine-generating enzyme required for sulfatase activity
MHLRPVAITLALFSALSALAQPGGGSGGDGIEWVTIGATGNRGYDRSDPDRRVTGRGAVNYEYRIGKYEVTSGQWAEFFAAALNRPDGDIPWVQAPFITGGTANPMLPTGGISWHTAAIYCNWLHNSKSSDRSAFLNGAYDVSTFGYGEEPGTFTDQLTHNQGARYWIPTWDEWLKAAHYDPVLDRWWEYSTTSDTRPLYGLPEGYPGGSVDNQANANYIDVGGNAHFQVLLGAYENVTSPWGLFDTAGGTSEWTEFAGGRRIARGLEGSGWASGAFTIDAAWDLRGAFPTDVSYSFGFRVASAIPSPNGVAVLGTSGMLFAALRRRRLTHDATACSLDGPLHLRTVPSISDGSCRG